MGLAGTLLYQLYHRPRTWLEEARDRRSATRWDSLMRERALRLEPLGLQTLPPLPPVRFLTGHRFAHQTAFCAYSFCWHLRRSFAFEFYDDGSLREDDTRLLLRLFPQARLITSAQRQHDVDRRFPKAHFPSLHRMREASPMMLKLMDLRAASPGPSLYLDSDMLFFAPAKALLEWLESPGLPLHMGEPGSGYVDTPSRLSQRLGSPVPRGVNAGLIAIDDRTLDWDRLEEAAARLDPSQQAHPWAEQTLTAWIMGRMAGSPLPLEDYKLCSNRTDVAGPPPVLRHYIYKAKMPYVQSEWKDCLALMRSEQWGGRP